MHTCIICIVVWSHQTDVQLISIAHSSDSNEKKNRVLCKWKTKKTTCTLFACSSFIVLALAHARKQTEFALFRHKLSYTKVNRFWFSLLYALHCCCFNFNKKKFWHVMYYVSRFIIIIDSLFVCHVLANCWFAVVWWRVLIEKMWCLICRVVNGSVRVVLMGSANIVRRRSSNMKCAKYFYSGKTAFDGRKN